MAYTIQYEVSGAAEVQHELTGIAERAIDARPAFKVIAEHLRQIEADLFEQEGAGAWPPLAETTVAYKAAHGLRPEILRATDDLMTSLTEEGGANIEYMTPEELVWGTSVDYARYHRDGGGDLPKRPPIIVSELQMREFTREIQRWVMGAE